jgi:hypothetical protein
MKTDTAAATSVRIKGSLTVSGQKLVLDLALNSVGGGYGTVDTGQGDLTVLHAGGKYYAQVTEAFIKQQNISQAEAAPVLGKYMLLGASETQGLDQFLDLKAFTALIATSGTDSQTITGTTQIAGTPVDIVTASDASTLYVAAEGKALPLRLIGAVDTSGQLDFLGWNTDLHIPGVPPASQVVDASQFAR